MAQTSSERLALAKIVRELERQLRQNMDAIFKPLIAHKDHVTFYYQAYSDYLARALSFEHIPQRESLLKAQATPLFVHRDNLGALAGRIGELAAALEASTIDIERDLENAQKEVARLQDLASIQGTEVGRLGAQVEALKRSSRARDVKELQAWGIGIGVAWALTFGWFEPGLVWLAGILAALNTSLILLAFRRSE